MYSVRKGCGTMKFNSSNSHWQEATRICPDCPKRGAQPLASFYRHRSRPNGRSVYCKKCMDARTHAERHCAIRPTRRRTKTYWHSDPSLVQSYISTFPNGHQAAKASGVGVATIYRIMKGARVTEEVETKIISAALKVAAVGA